jgi:hypothetical protein
MVDVCVFLCFSLRVYDVVVCVVCFLVYRQVEAVFFFFFLPIISSSNESLSKKCARKALSCCDM